MLDFLACWLERNDAELNNNNRRYFLWALANLTAGDEKEVSQVVQRRILNSIIISTLNSDYPIRKEAFYCVYNILALHKPEFVQIMTNLGIVNNLAHGILTETKAEMLEMILFSVENLMFCENGNVLQNFEQTEICNAMQNLLNHENQRVTNFAETLAKKIYAALHSSHS